MLKKTKIVVFDFDGTLSAYDSNVEFARYCFRHSVRPWLFLPLILVAGIVKFIKPSGIWWRQAMRCFTTADMVKKFAPDFISQHKQNRFGWARDQVIAEQDAGYTVILVSASPNFLLRALVADIPFDAVLCSEMDVAHPWKYKFLCWGRNKVVAMDDWARKNKIIPHVVRAYSDSKSDAPIMNIADAQVWINRKTGMRRDI